MFFDFFDKQHVFDSLKTLVKRRLSQRHIYLWIFLITMLFYPFQRDERPYTFLYTQYKFHWQTEEFSNFKVFLSTSQIIMVLFGVHIMTKFLKLQDTVVAMFGATNFVISRMFFAFAESERIFYVGGFFSSIGPVTGPILRSLVSKVCYSIRFSLKKSSIMYFFIFIASGCKCFRTW